MDIFKAGDAYIRAFRAEADRHRGGPCPHPRDLVDGRRRCHGCLTELHHVDEWLPQWLRVVFFIFVALALLSLKDQGGPRGDLGRDPCEPYCGIDLDRLP